MKAAVLQGARDIRVEDVPDPRVEPDGIVVKVNTCGICGSDLHPYRLGGPAGAILGHEITGDVIEVGANVTGVKEGERVFASPVRVCGQCRWCKQEQYLLCPSLALPPAHPGGFAEYVSIPSAKAGLSVVGLPGTMTYEEGATAEPLGVALYSVRQVEPQPEDVVVVIGVGVIGLCVIQVLKALGVSRIIASGRRSKRLQLARECGAAPVVDAAQGDIVSVVREEGAGELADIVFECAGSPAAFQQAIQVVRKGGKVVVVGLYEQPITWSPNIMVGKNVALVGCLGTDPAEAVDLLASGKADTTSLITHQFPLDKVQEAFETQLTADDAVKVLLKP